MEEKKSIIIEVHGGVAFVQHNPSDHVIEIRDYDVEGYGPGEIEQDSRGEWFKRQKNTYIGE